MSDAARVQSSELTQDVEDMLLTLLRKQGLAPKVIQHGNEKLIVRVNDGMTETDMSFEV